MDDKYALFIYNWSVYDWTKSKEHHLLTYTISGDTITLVDSEDEIVLSTDVLYDYNEAVGDGLIMFQTVFLNVYEDGFMSGDGFEYDSPCGKGIPVDSNDYYHTVVTSCSLSKFPLTIHMNTLDDINLDIDIPDELNHVKIYWNGIFSTYYSTVMKESYFPIQRVINDEKKVILFKWE